MILKADSGSTKTTWVLCLDNSSESVLRLTTQGINPFHQSEETIRSILTDELLRNEYFPSTDAIDSIYFYGAGCTKEKSPILAHILHSYFSEATTIDVGSDMLGAAKALCGTSEGIACILGTGANSCLYNGNEIVSNVSPMGYILGDEGSGAVIGRTFINLLYKGGHKNMIECFERETDITQADIIQRVYREPMPNRFLASMAPFIKKHLNDDGRWIEEMVIECFKLFFQRNVKHYERPNLPCSFVGSIAYFFEPQLRIAAQREGYTIGKIMKEPL